MEQGEALLEGVEAARVPSLEQAVEAQAGAAPLGAARVAANLARDGARADGALGQVVGGQTGHAHELEGLALVAEQAVAEGMAGVALVGQAGGPEPNAWASSSRWL